MRRRPFSPNRRPLRNTERARLTCHPFPAQGTRARSAGALRAKLEGALRLPRRAQFRVDFVSPENSMGFHAPREAARILAETIDYARQRQLEVVNAW